jgi:tetratricopeptide (TPR) repeat protein
VAVARTIRICSGVAALALFASTIATARTNDPSPLKNYAAGRMADIDGASAVAAVAYSNALVALPSDGALALRAYRQAIEAGDRAIALSAARTLDLQNALPADATLLLFTERLSRRDWNGGLGLLDRLDPKVGLGFLVPVLRAWAQYGAGSGDPLATLAVPEKDSLILAYAREHRALMLIARGAFEEGQAAAATLATPDARGIGLRLAAAAQLANRGKKTAALDLLKGDDNAIRAARALIEAGKPLGGAVNQPSEGVATLLSRVASDLMRDRATPAALTLARLANFSAPDDDMARLVLAQALLANGKIDGALAVLDQIKPTTIFAAALSELRIETLQQAGRDEPALALARIAASTPDASINEQLLLGQSYARLRRYREAADTYEILIKRIEGDNRAAKPGQGAASWSLWLLYGGALDAAKDWVRAKPALERAVALGPDQASALNHLGYAMLERGENLEEATKLVAKASALRPNDPAITDSLGWAFFKRGQTAEAITILETAVASDPTISETSEHLGDAYWTVGRRVDARYTWRAALIQAGDADVISRLNAKIADGLAEPRK